jgi:hypothetical protein
LSSLTLLLQCVMRTVSAVVQSKDLQNVTVTVLLDTLWSQPEVLTRVQVGKTLVLNSINMLPRIDHFN